MSRKNSHNEVSETQAAAARVMRALRWPLLATRGGMLLERLTRAFWPFWSWLFVIWTALAFHLLDQLSVELAYLAMLIGGAVAIVWAWQQAREGQHRELLAQERKGLDVLLDSMAELGSDVTLWVASNGPDTARLQARTRGDARIQWLGRLSDEENFRRLRGADVFCAPSLRGESFGVVLVEAMAADTCIVASALDGYRNVATDGVDSLLVPAGDVPALAGALRRALADRGLADRLVAAGARRADDFSMVTLAGHYERIYRALRDAAGTSTRQLSPWPRAPRLGRLARMMGRSAAP